MSYSAPRSEAGTATVEDQDGKIRTDYVLGHSDRELERLCRQGALFSDLTRDLLVRAGLKKAMHEKITREIGEQRSLAAKPLKLPVGMAQHIICADLAILIFDRCSAGFGRKCRITHKCLPNL